MKLSFFKTCTLSTLAALSLSGAALAAGNHTGGHGHDDGPAESAIGKPGQAASAKRSITVEMSDDMRFTPASIAVKQGETVRFIVKNVGQIKHEFSLGTQKELKEHYELMKKFPNMEHDEPNSVSLAAGKQGEVIWHFTKAGNVDFACLHPGHYEAGMKGQVKVGNTTVAVAQAQTAQAVKVAMPAEPALSDGEVRKIDREAGKLTIRHGELKHLDMPPMTMVFRVADVALLDAAQVGQKVRFSVEKRGGAMVITALERSE